MEDLPLRIVVFCGLVSCFLSPFGGATPTLGFLLPTPRAHEEPQGFLVLLEPFSLFVFFLNALTNISFYCAPRYSARNEWNWLPDDQTYVMNAVDEEFDRSMQI